MASMFHLKDKGDRIEEGKKAYDVKKDTSKHKDKERLKFKEIEPIL